MKLVDQTRFTGPAGGNCLAACLASILELPIEILDSEALSTKGTWWNTMTAILNDAGYQPFSYMPSGPRWPQIAPPGVHLACSASHACIALDGKVLWDPHPRRTGLAEITEWILLIPIASEAQRGQ